MPFVPGNIVTRKTTRQGRGEVFARPDWIPHRPERVWVRWDGSSEEPDHYDPSGLDHFNPESDEA